MHRKMFFITGVVVALVAALTVGLTVARSQEGTALSALTPVELLAKVAQEAPKTTAVSGDIAWTNDLLGAAALQMPAGDAGLASLMQGGSGRFWYQEGKLRFESQGSGGDTVAVLNGTTVWVYSSGSGTATEYTLPARPAGGTDSEASNSTDTTEDAGVAATGDVTAALDLPRKIQDLVDSLAPRATLSVATAEVAGRASYVLTMTPTAPNTIVGSAQVAFDGKTFLPLRVQVFAKGDAQPVLEAGFTKVSYAKVSADTFEFTPPADAKVEHSTLAMPAGMLGVGGDGSSDGGGAASPGESAKHAELTLDEAAVRAGFALAVPSDVALPFQGAAVIDTSTLGGFMMSAFSGSAMGGTAVEAPAPAGGAWISGVTAPAGVTVPDAPLVILRYGAGFGTVVVIETQIDDALWAQMTTALTQVPMLGAPSAFGGHQAYELGTRLGSLVAWRQGDVVVLMGGSVSQADLEAFASSIHE